jgi:hypothetical protein
MNRALPPGAAIGIIGGGQLGRMLAMAAARLGYRTIVLEPQPGCPAAQVANRQIEAAYDDPEALRALAAECDVVTYEFENVPVDAARTLAAAVPVFPPPLALEVSQDRLTEKQFLNSIGIATAGFRAVDNDTGLAEALQAFGGHGVLKTRLFGYDGKGQRVFGGASDANVNGAFAAMGGAPLILETLVPFEREMSVVAARCRDGAVSAYDAAENIHRDGILRRSIVPAAVSPELAEAAQLCRGSRRRVLRHQRRRSPGQRDSPPRSQFRTLDRGGLRHLAVRAAYPRNQRPAARQFRASLRLRDGEFDRRGDGQSGVSRRRTRSRPAPLRQGRIAPGPEDGSFYALAPKSLTPPTVSLSTASNSTRLIGASLHFGPLGSPIG